MQTKEDLSKLSNGKVSSRLHVKGSKASRSKFLDAQDDHREKHWEGRERVREREKGRIGLGARCLGSGI